MAYKTRDPSSSKTHEENVYQIKISLKGSKPPIWRRILISSKTRLPDLHWISQESMGWTDSHLHQFICGNSYLGNPELLEDGDLVDYTNIAIDRLLSSEGDKIVYEYDFGDGWEHDVKLEKIIAFEGQILPVCIAGKRACPPEDCGGVWGYYSFVESLIDSKHPAHKENREWIGENFDPDYFSVQDVNDRLGHASNLLK